MNKIVTMLLFSVSSVAFSVEFKNASVLKKCPKLDSSKVTFREQVSSWDNCFGTYVFDFDDESKGNKYEGEFKKGLPDGKGKYTFSDGEIYAGEWSKGVPHGNGTYKYKDGKFYEGEYAEGQKTKGKLKFTDGAFYLGFFKSGDFNGEGILVNPKGETINEGIWLDGKIINVKKTEFSKNKAPQSKKNIFPACPLPDETKDTHKERIAAWSNCHGVYEAKIDPMNGSIIEADFINGMANGYGKFTYPKGEAYFEGTFREGTLEFGLLKFSKASQLFGESYYGWFAQGIPNGYGEWQYANGNFYEGEIKDGMPNGAGIMYDKSSGKEFEGIWQEGKFVKPEKLAKGKQLARTDKKPITELGENILDNLVVAKKKCVDLGFKENTEKFGFCVLKMSRK